MGFSQYGLQSLGFSQRDNNHLELGHSGFSQLGLVASNSILGITVSCHFITTDFVHWEFGHYGYSRKEFSHWDFSHIGIWSQLIQSVGILITNDSVS